MKKAPIPSLFLMALLCACKPDAEHKVQVDTKTAGQTAARSSSYILVEPLAGRKLKVSITAKDKALYIVNCNAHITIALRSGAGPNPVWGGASDACLSPSIIVPLGATLSFVQTIGEGYVPLDTHTSYQVQVLHMVYGWDVAKAEPVPEEMATSNRFQLLL